MLYDRPDDRPDGQIQQTHPASPLPDIPMLGFPGERVGFGGGYECRPPGGRIIAYRAVNKTYRLEAFFDDSRGSITSNVKNLLAVVAFIEHHAGSMNQSAAAKTP